MLLTTAGAATLLVATACSSLTETDECGKRFTPRVPLTLATMGDYYGPLGNVSQASWVILVDGVCAHRHSTVEYEVRLQALAGVAVDPFVIYGVNRVRTLPDNYRVEDGIHVLSGSDNFGVRDVFGDEPGQWTFIVTVEFPYQGSGAADSAYIHTNIVGGEMKAEWWMMK